MLFNYDGCGGKANVVMQYAHNIINVSHSEMLWGRGGGVIQSAGKHKPMSTLE
jgi:hypothetical protein